MQVPGNASTYGDNTVEDFGGAWQFIEDTGNAWYAAQVAAGKSDADIKAELASFDVWDRYDYDNDGNFDEPDGYLDHFQAVHAGEGEDAGGGAQGEDAIWSHRWYVNSTDYGITGPADAKFGGAQIGDTGFWIGDYTVEAENGGLGVFAHEFGHDLGLPDFYDTDGGENGTAFWTLMSSGSWLNHGIDDIGTTPDYMGPWEKLQLGWLDYSVVTPGASGCVHAEPGRAAGRRPGPGARHRRARRRRSRGRYMTPNRAATAWWTISADDLNTTLDPLARPVGRQQGDGHRQGLVRHRGRLRLPLRRVLDRRRRELDDGGTAVRHVERQVDDAAYTVPGGNADTLFRFRYQTRRRRAPRRRLHRRHRREERRHHAAHRRRRERRQRLDRRGRLQDQHRHRDQLGRPLLPGREPHVRRLRRDAARRSRTSSARAYTAPDQVEHFPFQDGMLVWAVDETYTDNNTIDHQATASRCRSTRARRRSPTPTARCRATGASRSTRPSACSRSTRSSLHKEILVGKGKSQTVQSVEAVGTDRR